MGRPPRGGLNQNLVVADLAEDEKATVLEAGDPRKGVLTRRRQFEL